jgi:hypothetical protein
LLDAELVAGNEEKKRETKRPIKAMRDKIERKDEKRNKQII